MHRSGTSLIAHLLHELGISMGTRFRESDRSNPTGYWEDLDWRDLNEKILREANGRWWRIPSRSDLMDAVENHRDEITALVANRVEPWGFKDPRFTLLAEFYQDSFEDAKYIVVDRPRDDVVGSLMRRAEQRGYQESRRHWESLYERYRSHIEDFLKTHGPEYLRVSYPEFVDKMTAEGAVRELANFVGVDFDPQVLGVIRIRAGRLLREDRDGNYRTAVGPEEEYDVIAARQFQILVAAGLREYHRLVDIGCGSLRGGRLFIPYLNPENYYGIEPNMWLVEEGLRHELGGDILNVKRPNFYDFADLKISRIGKIFDFALAQSVFSHTPQWAIRRCLRTLWQSLTPDGIFMGTFWHRPNDYTGVKYLYHGDMAGYTRRTLDSMFSDAGFRFSVMDYEHPAGQTWFRADKITTSGDD
ncbi:hypothetical protein GF373_17660 [bacterium]|nr:hypothetical protein [bacterium]